MAWISHKWSDDIGVTMDRLDWQPGEYGKGIVDQDGHIHTWNEDDYETHHDYLQTHPDSGSPKAYFYIDPEGTVDVSMPSIGYDPQGYHLMMEYITDADPHFKAATKNTWSF